jgi:putative transposase
MYRILSAEHDGVKERRDHVQRPHYSKPELLATAPNQVWSWDISVLQQRRRQFVGCKPEVREAA